MSSNSLVRDYENPNLSLEQRLPSLARRFPCLERADGLDPWSPNAFYEWALSDGEGTSRWHAAHLVLNLEGKGPWKQFDAIAAIQIFGDADRLVFSSWAKTWKSSAPTIL